MWAVIGRRLGCGGWGLGFDVGVEPAGLFPERGFGAFMVGARRGGRSLEEGNSLLRPSLCARAPRRSPTLARKLAGDPGPSAERRCGMMDARWCG